MENYDLPPSGVPKGENANVISNPVESHSPIRRELDSVDDFEHLDHEAISIQNQAGDNEGQLLDFLKSDIPQQPPKTQNFGLMDDLHSFQGDTHDKFTSSAQKDPFFSGLDAFTGGGNGGHVSNVIDSTKSFMDFERQPLAPTSKESDFKDTKSPDYGFDEPPPATKFDDDDDDDDDEFQFKDFSKKKDDFGESKPVLDEFKDFSGTDMSFAQSTFSDAIAEPKQPKPVFEESTTQILEPKPVEKPVEPAPAILEPEIKLNPLREPSPEPIREPSPEPIREPSPEPIREPTPEPPREPTPEPLPKPAPEPQVFKKQEVSAKPKTEPELPVTNDKVLTKPIPKKEEREVIAAEAMFCQMGLDAWFNPERLNPKVESLIYWRCPRKSGIVFGVSLALLLALSCFSLISVLAYASLTAVCGCMAFRIYRNVLQAVQKTSDGHPFKELLETDVSVSQEKAQQVATVAVTHLNAAVSELRRLFLVEDLVDSTKFIVLLWCLTYLGAWFNGMTLIIIAFVALFTLPKVYETNKTQIDANLDVVRSKLQEITSKVKAAVPIGKKAESDKDK